MKKFKYTFSRLTFILILVGLAVCLAGFIVNLVICITDGISHAVNPVIPLVLYILSFIVTIAAGALLSSILFSSYYEVGERYLKTAFGFIKSSYEVKKIDTIVLDRETNKLLVYMEDGSYIIIVIRSERYPDFVQAVLDVNPLVGYAIQSLENSPDDNSKKK